MISYMIQFILAQVFGAVALVIICIGYFVKTKPIFLLTQVAGNFFYALAFFVVGAYVGAALVMISLFRCIYIYISEKYSFRYLIHFLSIFIVAYIVTTILFWDTVFDLMPLSSSILFTIGYTISNLQTMRYILIVPNSILIVYNILTTTYTSALLDFIEVVVIVIAIVKHYQDNKPTKKRLG